MSPSPPSERFVLRFVPGLRGDSPNEYGATRLAAPTGEPLAFRGAQVMVRRAAAVHRLPVDGEWQRRVGHGRGHWAEEA